MTLLGGCRLRKSAKTERMRIPVVHYFQIGGVRDPKSRARDRVAGQLTHPLLIHRAAPDGAL